jgi:uncharacterized RDD family membrane protein YckC
MHNQTVNAGIRIATMVLDHLFMCLIAMLFYLPMLVSIIAYSVSTVDEQEPYPFENGPLLYLGIFGFTLYFLKDIINGRSLAKLILKLQLVDNKTGEVASPLQCFVRNLFCIIWPVEFIVALANPGRRIGDRVAGTRLVYYNPAIHKAKPGFGKFIFPIIICVGLTVLLAQVLPTPEFDRTIYKKSSYNQAESKELEKLITDSLGEYVVPVIKIYDTVENSNLKYLSAIINLKENYLEGDNSYRQLHKMTTLLIYDRLPKETFTGRVKYIFRGHHQFQSRSTSIGKRTPN